MSPSLAGGVLTTGPPGKSEMVTLLKEMFFLRRMAKINRISSISGLENVCCGLQGRGVKLGDRASPRGLVKAAAGPCKEPAPDTGTKLHHPDQKVSPQPIYDTWRAAKGEREGKPALVG